ncbi:MAG: crotonase/enoyl-CoA hydratase family protein [Acidiferrobacterales bacterium]
MDFPLLRQPHMSGRSSYVRTVPEAVSALKRPQSEEFCDTYFDKTYGVLWASLKPTSPARFTPPMVTALRQLQIRLESRIRRHLAARQRARVHYLVFSSRIPRVFSLGGDLEFFRRMITTQDRDALSAYAQDCIALVYKNAVNYQLPVTTISLVQGAALGGGFEAALAANVVVAERQSEMGFPESLVNLFPGMGAYQLLARRLTPVEAERLILSGRVYKAEELYEMGVIDVLADQERGEDAVWNYVKRHSRQAHAWHGLRRAIEVTSPIRHEDLTKAVAVWVDTALGLGERDLKRMERLIRAQAQMSL